MTLSPLASWALLIVASVFVTALFLIASGVLRKDDE